VEIPGSVLAGAEVLAGPATLRGRHVQVHNPAGAEAGPGAIATQGKATADNVQPFGFQWERAGRPSKHMGFDWPGPDAS
jgi:hypothetical protein